MRVPLTPATTLQRELRSQLRHNSPAGRVVVAVDGWDGDRTCAFADSFAAVIGEDGDAVMRASLSDFLLPRADRADIPYDLPALRRVLIDPFRSGVQTASTGFQLEFWDAERDAPVEARWTTAPADAVLVIDGPFAQVPELRGQTAFAVWLEVSEAVLARRPGRSLTTPLTDAEAAYARTVRPLRTASVLVDDTDPTRPFEFYRDFC